MSLGLSGSGAAKSSGAVSMSIQPLGSYSAGQLPAFRVSLTNTGQEPVTLCTYMLKYRILASMVAETEGTDYELQPFQSFSYRDLTPEDFVTLAPGEAHSLEVNLAMEKQWGFVRRHSQPPIIPATHVVSGLPAGKYLFRIALSDQMAVYVGQSGVFDRRLEARTLPKDFPASGNLPDFYRRFLEAEVEVPFR